VGAVEGGGGGEAEEKFSMRQRRILFSLAHLERMRSAWKETLGGAGVSGWGLRREGMA